MNQQDERDHAEEASARNECPETYSGHAWVPDSEMGDVCVWCDASKPADWAVS